MRNSLYLKLALSAVTKNRIFYLPYLITCIFSVAMFYDLSFIADNKGLPEMSGGDILKLYMRFGVIIIGIFACVFLFYTNSFLIKNRKKELGVYNILGLTKGNIACVLSYETIISAVITLFVGLIIGIIFSKLMLLLLCAILKMPSGSVFSVSTKSVAITAVFFAVIYLFTLIYNLISVKISKPIELLNSGKSGEREPKANWLIAVLGLISLCGGYYIALKVNDPMSAVLLFFLAVLLVIFGTYALFISGSIAVLKLLRKNKGYYYKPRHFTAISGMLYRMKQNAAGLAGICILSTMVLVTVSITVCLYAGVMDMVNDRQQKSIGISYKSDEMLTQSDSVIQSVSNAVAESGVNIKDAVYFNYLSVTAERHGTVYSYVNKNTTSAADLAVTVAMPESDYARITGKQPHLKDNEALYTLGKATADYKELTVFEEKYSVKSADDIPMADIFKAYTTPVIFFVVSDSRLSSIYENQAEYFGIGKSPYEWYYTFDLDGSIEQNTAAANKISSALSSLGEGFGTESRDSMLDEFYKAYGGLFFIGIFLGLMFVGFTALIIYYKQISEGSDDRERYQIMQKIGMSHEEVEKSVNSQVLKVFFLPLTAAVIHLAFAFRMIKQILSVFNCNNVPLFLICVAVTTAVFAAVYFAIYYFTAKIYQKIVRV